MQYKKLNLPLDYIFIPNVTDEGIMIENPCGRCTSIIRVHYTFSDNKSYVNLCEFCVNEILQNKGILLEEAIYVYPIIPDSIIPDSIISDLIRIGNRSRKHPRKYNDKPVENSGLWDFKNTDFGAKENTENITYNS